MSTRKKAHPKKTAKRTRKPAAKPAEPSPAFAQLDRLERHVIEAIAGYDGIMKGIVYVPTVPECLIAIVGDIRTLRLTLRYDLGDKAVQP